MFNEAGAVILDFGGTQGQQQSQGVAGQNPMLGAGAYKPFDLGDKDLQNDVDLYENLHQGVAELNQFASELMAKGINPTQPDYRNPESFAYSRAYRQRAGELERMANDLRIGAQASKEYQKQRLDSSLRGAPLDASQGPTTWSDLGNITQTAPLFGMVDEINNVAKEYKNKGSHEEAEQRIKEGRESIEQTAGQMIENGENPAMVEQIKQEALARLNPAMHSPPIFKPNKPSNTPADGSAEKVFADVEFTKKLLMADGTLPDAANNLAQSFVGKEYMGGTIKGAAVSAYTPARMASTGNRGALTITIDLASNPVLVPDGKESEYADIVEVKQGRKTFKYAYSRIETILFSGDGAQGSAEFNRVWNILQAGRPAASTYTSPEAMIGQTSTGKRAVTGAQPENAQNAGTFPANQPGSPSYKPTGQTFYINDLSELKESEGELEADGITVDPSTGKEYNKYYDSNNNLYLVPAELEEGAQPKQGGGLKILGRRIF